jgi:arylsulfatase A-like enzyme
MAGMFAAHLSFAGESLHPDLPRTAETGVGTAEWNLEWSQIVTAPKGAPNVVLILLDDAGFGASSTFGGPVQTPELDRMAAHGLRYTRFHAEAACSPTRASLLSGRNAHQASFGTVTELANRFHAHTGVWKKDTVSVAEVLRRNGYSTAAFGKWHNTPYWEINPTGPFDRWPTGLGFEYFYGFMAGAGSQWEPSLYRNTLPVEPPASPAGTYHLTTDLAGEAIRWLHTHESITPQKPYFLYFAPGATHDPHHVATEWIEKYRARFDNGWDHLREETYSRQKNLGIIPADTVLTSRPKQIPSWSSLPADQKRLLARQMEVFAAFMAHTDYEVGRLIRAVQQGPQGDNTLILYIASDNGADGKAGLDGRDVSGTLQARLAHIDDLGSDLLLNEYATGWAWAMNTPFQWMKQIASHFGGTRVPLVVSWPSRIMDGGEVRSQFSHVNDIAATIYEATRIRFPSVVDGVKQQPLDGPSLMYSFDNPLAPSRHRTQLFELVGNRAIYHDGWLAGTRHNDLPWHWSASVNNFDEDLWELYHVDVDFSQANDLARVNPKKLAALKALFKTEARRMNIGPVGAGRGNIGQSARQPSPAGGRNEFVYYADLPRIQSNPYGSALPDFSRSHTLTADLIIPEAAAQGVLISYGSRWGGFVLYVKDGFVVYESNLAGRERQSIKSSAPLPHGKASVTFEFRSDDESGNGLEPRGDIAGIGRLKINEQLSGEGQVKVNYGRGAYFGSFGVGRAFGSPVSPSIEVPFEFTGTIERVTVNLARQHE